MAQCATLCGTTLPSLPLSPSLPSCDNAPITHTHTHTETELGTGRCQRKRCHATQFGLLCLMDMPLAGHITQNVATDNGIGLCSALHGSEQSEQYFDIDIGVGVESNRDVARDAHGS